MKKPLPLGFEVGQRMDAEAAQWNDPTTAAILPLDVYKYTQTRQRALAARHALGFSILPTWMTASSRVADLTTSGSYRYPDISILRAVRDIAGSFPLTILALGARFSTDPAFSMSTGPGIPKPRTAYLLGDITFDNLYLKTPSASAIVDNYELESADPGFSPSIGAGTGSLGSGTYTLYTHIRPASSSWDFLTAIDPVWLTAENGGVVLRNLDPFLEQKFSLPRGTNSGAPILQSAVTIPNLQVDGNMAAIWDDARSLRDDLYTPPLMTVAPTAAGLDLGADPTPKPTGNDTFWQPAPPVYPTPQAPTIVLNDPNVNEVWPGTHYPAGLTGSPDDGFSRLIFPTVPAATGTTVYAVFNGQTSTVQASPIELANGWDDAGQLIRLPRRPQENDFLYSGRQQRLWIAAQIAARDNLGLGSKGHINRTLSAALNRTFIVDFWDGLTSAAVPTGTTHIDVASDPSFQDSKVLRLASGELVPMQSTAFAWYQPTPTLALLTANPVTGTSLSFKATESLADYENIHVILADTTLVRGRDWVFSRIDPSVLVFAQPMGTTAELSVVLSGRTRGRYGYSFDPSTGVVRSSSGKYTLQANNRQYLESTSPADSLTHRTAGRAFYPASLLPEVGRAGKNFQNGWTSPLIISQGPYVRGAEESQLTLLTETGRILRTSIGQDILNGLQKFLWETPSRDGDAPIVGLPMDMDLATDNHSPLSDGCVALPGGYF